jgi:predicted ribosomally synthesized peptide with nif11-like leader
MTTTAANAALDRIEADQAFATRVKDSGGHEQALSILHSEGFDVSQQDMRDAFIDRFGDQLTKEQLDAVAGGIDRDVLLVAAGSGLGAAAVVLAAAAIV